MISKLLFLLYKIKNKRIRKIILRFIVRFEHGQVYSKTIRKIFSFYHNIEIGKYSYGGCFDSDAIASFTKIGNYCSFADDIHIYSGNHPLDFKSMHPFFYNPVFGYVQEEQISRSKLEIGNDVWIGHGVLIMPSVKSIGDGAVLGAGAVVTKDVPDYAIVAGNPAKIIKYRFTEQVQEKIKNSKWWDKDMSEVKKDLDGFTRKVGADAS